MTFLSKRFFRKPNFVDELLNWQNIPRKKNNKFYLFNKKIAKKKYTYRRTDCLCGNDNDILISSIDRFRCEYELVLCNSCGLIRAKNYWNEDHVSDFYKNYYINTYSAGGRLLPKDIYLTQIKNRDRIWNIIENNVNLKSIKKDFIIADVGGQAGGAMDFYRNKCKCVLLDYDQSLLDYAAKKGITVFRGGAEQLSKNNIFPDIIILSHVIEHWSNFDNELKNLLKNLKENALVYIEVPGIDRFDVEPSYCDFLGDIQIPHFYYFSSNTLKNIFERNGFETMFINKYPRAIFKFTNNKKPLVNFSNDTIKILKYVENRRKRISIKHNLIKFIKYILELIYLKDILICLKNFFLNIKTNR